MPDPDDTWQDDDDLDENELVVFISVQCGDVNRVDLSTEVEVDRRNKEQMRGTIKEVTALLMDAVPLEEIRSRDEALGVIPKTQIRMGPDGEMIQVAVSSGGPGEPQSGRRRRRRKKGNRHGGRDSDRSEPESGS